MSSSDRGGIQALLAAEQDAQHIVTNARSAKTARLRQAKEEAEREVAHYRAQREAEFKKKLQDTSGDSGANVKRLEAETDEKIKRLSAEAAKVAPEVTALLMNHAKMFGRMQDRNLSRYYKEDGYFGGTLRLLGLARTCGLNVLDIELQVGAYHKVRALHGSTMS